MTIPLIILAVCAVLVGLIFGPDATGCSSTTSSKTFGFEGSGTSRTGTPTTGRPPSSARWPASLGLALS